MQQSKHQFLNGQKIVIVGAGLVGTLGAIMLAKRGAKVQVIERQTFDPKKDYSNQRSFNITISSRGEAALVAAGIWPRVKSRTIPITGRMCHMDEAKKFPYSRNNSVALHGARRSDVNAELLAAAMEIESISFRFGYMLTDLDKEGGSITIAPVSGEGPTETVTDADFVIGADGIGSAVRNFIHNGEQADFARRFLEWNYREVFIPAGTDPKNPWQMDPNSLHIWPRGDLMMFALPNPDGSFTGNFIYPISRDNDFKVPGRIDELFRTEFPDVAKLVPDAGQSLQATPPSYFQTQRNSKWFHGDKFVLVGDAAAATVPFYGQGMNSGFESMVELINCLERFPAEERAQAFAMYQKNRKPHTDAVADLSIANFDELRSNFQHLLPQARRKVEVFLHRMLGEAFVPLHVKVSHSLIGYRTAIDESARRYKILRYCGFDLLVYGAAAWQLLSGWMDRVRHHAPGVAADIVNTTKMHVANASDANTTAVGVSADRRPDHSA